VEDNQWKHRCVIGNSSWTISKLLDYTRKKSKEEDSLGVFVPKSGKLLVPNVVIRDAYDQYGDEDKMLYLLLLNSNSFG
jgi:hypothetical protein